VLDIQENPIADLAILSLIDFTLKNLVQETWYCFADQKTWSTVDLEQILLDCIQSGEKTMVQNHPYSAVFGLPTNRAYSAGEIWHHLIESYAASSAMPELFTPWYRLYQQEGTLASRILKAIPLPSEEKTLHSVYQQLCQCLLAGTHFHAQ